MAATLEFKLVLTRAWINRLLAYLIAVGALHAKEIRARRRRFHEQEEEEEVGLILLSSSSEEPFRRQ